MTSPGRLAASLFLAILTAAGVVSARQGRTALPGANASTAVTSDVLERAGTSNDPLPGTWLSYGRTHQETRFSPLTQINRSNAKELGLAWTYVMGAGGGNQEGTPLVWNDTLYGITSWSVVFALDARTGKELWRWASAAPQ